MLQGACGLRGDRSWAVASGFGGGIARYQSLCGALTGGVMVLGLLEAQRVEDPKRIAAAARPAIRRLWDGFEERFGSVECRALVPFDFNSPDWLEVYRQTNAKQKCHEYVRYVIESLMADYEARREGR